LRHTKGTNKGKTSKKNNSMVKRKIRIWWKEKEKKKQRENIVKVKTHL